MLLTAEIQHLLYHTGVHLAYPDMTTVKEVLGGSA